MRADNQIELISPIGSFVTAEIINATDPEDTIRQGVLIDPEHLLGESITVYPVDISKPITIVPDKNLCGSTEIFARTTRTLMKHRELLSALSTPNK